MGAIRIVVVCVLVCCVGSAYADGDASALGLLNKGIQFFEESDFASAQAAFMRARDLSPQRPNPHRWLGFTDARLGQCQDAIGELDAFLALVPPADSRVPEAMTVRARCANILAPPSSPPDQPRPAVVPMEVVTTTTPPVVTPARRRLGRGAIAGIVVGSIVVVGLAVGLGVGLTVGHTPQYPAIEAAK